MSLKTFPQAPYYDDYDEDKKYLRMLFRPGVSLQVRELNQLQTYLQTQIERLGLHLFKEGAMVVPGQTAIDTKIVYLKIESETNGVEISTILDQLIGKSLTNDSGVSAQVITYVDQEDTDPITLMVRYTSSSDTNVATKVFALNELLYATIDSEQVFVQIQSAAGSIGVGSIASIQRGIYFVKSQFAMVDEAIIVLDKYSNTPSYRVGLTINENIVTSNTDATLNDNSNGTPNENAPGAHRYQLNLTLSKLAIDSILDENFLELMRVDYGQLQSQVTATNYSELAKTLARRTYDESGNYTVRAFKMALREHRSNDRGEWQSFTNYRYGDVVTSGGVSFVCLETGTSGGIDPSVTYSATNPYQTVDDGNLTWDYTDRPPYNRGLFTPENGGDHTKFAVAIEPGKAYVQGYEVEKIATEFLPVDKSQTYDRIDSDSVDIKYGNYIFVNNLHGLPDCSTYPTIALFNQLSPASSIQTAGAGTQVGTARLRGLEYHSGTPGIGAIYKAYLFDVTMSAGYTFERDVKQLFYASGTTLLNITADVCNVYPALTGTISASTTTITGVGTKFTTQLKVGDYIYVENSVGGFESARVATITSNTVLAIAAAFSGTVTGKAFARHQTAVQDPSYTALLFPLAYSFIRKVKGGTEDNVFGTSYTTTQRFDGSTTSGQTSLTISIGSPTGATTLGTEFNPAAGVNAYVVINRSTGLPVSPSNVTLSNAGATAVFSGLTQSQSYTVFAPVRKSGSIAQQKTKTLVSNAVKDFTTAATVAPVTLSLGKADGNRLVKVLMKNSGYTASSDPASTTDITDWYTFDDGQTETHYDIATITRKDGYPVPKGAVRVIFDYFSHTVGGAGDYFSVDSYSIPYEKIPYFVYAGGSIALADVLDFRPRINDAGTAYSSTGASQSELPKLGFETIASYSYYLSRRDKIALDIDGKFYTIPGVPSLTPQEPKDPELGMLLAKANMSPYTLYPDKGSVIIETVDNKRYTMRDIGKLDKRIENLEYYTALSLLESDTKSLSIQDEAGLERFKNGFIVDNFKGQSLGDIGSVEYRCSIDMTNQELRPFYTMDNVNLVEENQLDSDRTADGYQLTGDIITLPYNSIEFIKQPFASRTENVNPFAIFTFLGTMALNPPSDDWFETDRRPDVVTNVEGNFSAVLAATEKSGALGTVWGAWETTWTGASRNIDRLVVTTGFDTTDYGLGNGKWADRRTFNGAELAAIGGDAVNFGQDGVGRRVLTYQTTATTIGQSRTGITTSVTPKTDYEVVDDKVLNTSIIPYIRSRELLFVCQGLKPNTKVNAYFDGTAIGSYITPATKIPVVQNGSVKFDTTTNAGAAASDIGRQYNGAPSTAYNKGDVVYVKTRGATTYNSQITSPARAVVVAVEKASDTGAESIYVMNVSGTFTAGDVLAGSLSDASYICTNTITTAAKGDDLVTNFNGTLAGVFSIPNNDGARFRTGIREFKLTDSPTNGLDFTTQGRGQYRAQGVIETKQRSINAVRNAEVVTKPASESRTDEIFSSERLIRDTGWYDPLAQTIMINSKGGAFLTGVDVFFATKDPNIPVHCQLRESVNGYPGTGILPFSKVALTPDRVNTSADGINPDPGSTGIATRFTFDSPIYVNDQTEYCFVLLSDSNQYRVWISQLGEKNVGTDRFISDQPYAGVLFKSQNASTWTANQEQDLKFTVYRAQFDTNATGTVTFNNDILPPAILDRDPFKTTFGTSKVRVKHKNHGMPNGSNVLISNVAAATYNGIATTLNTGFNGTFAISNAESDSYVIDVGTNATATGYVGGTDIVATENVPMDAMSFMTQSQTFSDTALRYSALVTNTSYAAGTTESDEYDVIPNQTLYFNSSHLVASQVNEDGPALDGEKSLKVKARLSTTNDAVSPVIDTSRLSVATIKNRIDNFTFATKNVIGLDDIVIIDAGNGVTFDSGAPTVISIPSTSRGAVKGIAVGKYISISGTTTNDTVTPVRVIDVAEDGSTITTSGAFSTQSPSSCTITLKDNFVAEDAPIGGSATSKYLTRLINLENPSTHMTILFAANIPPVTDSDVEVWYKLVPTGTNGDISQYDFVRATSPNKPIVKSSSSSEFRDIQYDLSDLPAFDAVVVKLVFKSANSAQTPRVKDLRIIACA
jgi:hypothetical protein